MILGCLGTEDTLLAYFLKCEKNHELRFLILGEPFFVSCCVGHRVWSWLGPVDDGP